MPPSASPVRPLLRLKIVALVLLLAGVAGDLWTKAHFEDLLGMSSDPQGPAAERRIEVIEGFLAWEGTYNPGVTFGLAPNRTSEIVLLTVAATLILGVWLAATQRPSLLLHVALAFILSGALGNLYDRWHWQKVRDFVLIYFGTPGQESFKWPNFNLADSLIVVGVILVLWDAFFGSAAEKKSHPAPSLQEAAPP